MLWVNGGLATYNFDKNTYLVPIENQLVLNYEKGPQLREPRVLHCSLTINATHSFIHGGFTPITPNKNYPVFYKDRSNNPGHRFNGYTSWTFDQIDNKTANSYMYDWKRKIWIRVRTI